MSITNKDGFNKIFKDLVSEIMEISLEDVKENILENYGVHNKNGVGKNAHLIMTLI